MQNIYNQYYTLCKTPSDINKHLPTLAKYASECHSVLELGVRGCVSSWAFVFGLLNNNFHNKLLFLNDIQECNINNLLYLCSNYDSHLTIKYKWINDLLLDIPYHFDLTFIDTWHVYAQLKRELDKFSKITNKYIILHDTTIDGIFGETIRNSWDPLLQSSQTNFPIHEITRGIWPAVTEFLDNNTNWILLEKFNNNNGLTILKKIS